MALTYSTSQFAKRLGSGSQYLAPMWYPSLPTLAPLVVGSPVSLSGAAFIGVPTPTVTYAITVGGVTKAWPYTLQLADIGAVVNVAITLSSLGNSVTLNLSGTVPPIAAAPAAVSAVNFLLLQTTSMTVFWSAPGGTTTGQATSYTVGYRVSGTSPWTTQSTTNLSMALPGLASGTSYDVEVIAVNAYGQSAATIGTQSTNSILNIGVLGFLGGNISSSTDYTYNYLFNNALRDTRGFTPLGKGDSTTGTVAVDANGNPTTACTLVINTVLSGYTTGPNAPGTYYINYQSAGQAQTMSYSSAGAPGLATVGTPTLMPDGVTTRYPITIAAGAGSVAVDFSGPIQYPEMARDGSVTSVGQPEFYQPAIAQFSQQPILRLMDFLNTNTRLDTTWSTRPGNFAIRSNVQANSAFPWDAFVKFINACVAYPGSKVKEVWACYPPYADDNYCQQLPAYLNTLGLTSAVKIVWQNGNEHWNSAFKQNFNYTASAVAETMTLSNYGASLNNFTSVVTDGTKATFTTTNPIGAYLPASGTASCIVTQNVGGFVVGSLATPAVATWVDANTFTVPTTATARTLNSTNDQVAVSFGLSSTLLADNQFFDVYSQALKYGVRRLYQIRALWSAVRPQDLYFIDSSLYGSTGQTGGGALNSGPADYAYAVYLGGGSASWLYGAAIGFYLTASSSNTDLTTLFANLNTTINGQMVAYVKAHVYRCKQMGIHPMAYEGGVDMQACPSLIPSAMTDSRMGDAMTSLLNVWFSYGGEKYCNYFNSPARFVVNAQGGWSASQTYSDTSSPKYAALLAYQSNNISYASDGGAPKTLSINFFQYALGGGQTIATSGAWYFYDATKLRQMDWIEPFPDGGLRTFTPSGTCSAATPIQVLVDGTVIGTCTLPANGSGSSTSSLPGPVLNPVQAMVSQGPHIVSYQIAANAGSNPGVVSINVT